MFQTVLLRSDGSVVGCGLGLGLSLDQPLPEHMSWTQVSTGGLQLACLRSDGRAFSFTRNNVYSDVPSLEVGMSYTQVSAGYDHMVLLRSDGRALACGSNAEGQCNIPPLEVGTSYIHVAAGGDHTMLLRSDGSAVACGSNRWGQCRIPSPKPGSFFICDHLLMERDIILQLDALCQDHSVTLVCSNLAKKSCVGRCRCLILGSSQAHRELNVSLRLKIVLPNGQLLDSLYLANRHPDIRDLLGMQPPPPPVGKVSTFAVITGNMAMVASTICAAGSAMVARCRVGQSCWIPIVGAHLAGYSFGF